MAILGRIQAPNLSLSGKEILKTTEQFMARQATNLATVISSVFKEIITFTLELIPIPLPSIDSYSVAPINASTFLEFSSYLATNIAPMSTSITKLLKTASQIQSESLKQDHYNRIMDLYLTMQAHIQAAETWVKKHPDISHGKRFHDLQTDLHKSLRLIDSITRTHPDISFLQKAPHSKPIPPIGRRNEGGNDCFMNALMQLLMGCPSLFENVIKRLPNDQFQRTRTHAALHRLAQIRHERAPIGGSRALRADINMLTRHQEDASEALLKILEVLPTDASPYINIQTTRQLDLSAVPYDTISPYSQESVDEEGWMNPQQDPVGILSLPFQGVSLESCLASWALSKPNGAEGYRVETTTEEGVRTLPFKNEENNFIDLPEEFLFEVKRYRTDENGTHKIKKAIDIPPRFVIHEDFVETRKNGKYRIDGFIVHRGETPQSGHYYTYIRQQDGTWIKCDDRNVTRVQPSNIGVALQSGYIYYTKKIDELSTEEADDFLKMRELQAKNLQMRQAFNATRLPREEQESPLKQLEKSVEFFLKSLTHEDPADLQSFFESLPENFQTLCKKALELEGKTNLSDLTTIRFPCLLSLKKEGSPLNIIEQYLYYKKNFLACTRLADDQEQSFIGQLRLYLLQLKALKALLKQKNVTKEHFELALPFINEATREKIEAALEGPLNKDLLKEELVKMIKSTEKVIWTRTSTLHTLQQWASSLMGT